MLGGAHIILSVPIQTHERHLIDFGRPPAPAITLDLGAALSRRFHVTDFYDLLIRSLAGTDWFGMLAGGLCCGWWSVAAEDGFAVGAGGAGGSVGQEFDFPAQPVDADVMMILA
jgi:hypothetical protein